MQSFTLLDGGLGTMLQAAGLSGGQNPEIWNIQQPDTVKSIHRAYLNAGAQVISANTFGANAHKLQGSGCTPQQLVAAGVQLAKQAISDSGKSARVALDIGSIGQLLQPMGTLAFEDAVAIFSEMIRAGTDAGADLVLIETMSDLYEAKAAVLAAKETCNLPVWCSMTFAESGRTLTGSDVQTCVTVLEGLGADAVGLNCGLGPAQCLPLAREFVKYASVPVLVQPNAGLPQVVDGKTVFSVTPDAFAAQMAEIAASGAHILGGCCGTTPDHIAALRQTVASIPYQAPAEKSVTAASTSRKTVVFGEQPVTIGERINPSGKKDLTAALQNSDMDVLIDQALDQLDAGCTLLDINVGVPGIDQRAAMRTAVEQIQAVAPNAPLAIDSNDPAVLEAGLRVYNGKPVLNSVTGKQADLDAILPLAKKYGCLLVGLCMDETGIPETPAGRLAIARRIVEAARQYGIAKKEILIDPLTLSAGIYPAQALTAIETLPLIRRELGVHTVLGISNISYGLPGRPVLNAAYLSMALAGGLSCPILDPGCKPVADALLAGRLLTGGDADMMEYLSAMR